MSLLKHFTTTFDYYNISLLQINHPKLPINNQPALLTDKQFKQIPSTQIINQPDTKHLQILKFFSKDGTNNNTY